MEKIEQVELMLLNLPTDVIEEILLHLNLQDRKNIRLTSKWLYELCNSTHICMKEKIIWKKNDLNFVNLQPALLTIGRSCYNLEIDSNYYYDSLDNRDRSIILQFLEVNGAKVRSLAIKKDYFAEGFLEALIISCEDLRSLTLLLATPDDSPPLDYFTLESNTIIRPTVTYLELFLPEHQPSKCCHRMLSVFPNVKQLKIGLEHYDYDIEGDVAYEIAEECSDIFDDLMKCSNLESLKLDIPLREFSAKGSQFPEAFSKLKDLSMEFNDYAAFGEQEKLYSCFSNLVSLKLTCCRNFQLVRVLKNTQLNYLNVSSDYASSMVLNEASFKALVSSKLKILRLQISSYEIQGLSTTVLDSPPEANRTVTDLYLNLSSSSLESPVLLFLMYFRGLVHLSIGTATDAILQCIFQYQQNLRSLRVSYCKDCSEEGFCGSKDGSLKYSINNLRKLEHLSIGCILFEIIASDEFKNVFNFPSLEYLYIDGIEDRQGVSASIHYVLIERNAEAHIRFDLFENLTHLRALRIRDAVIPPLEPISSLLINSKHLNYLCFDVSPYVKGINPLIIINSEEFSINLEDYKYSKKYSSGNSDHSTDLDRMVVLNEEFSYENLCCPKISSHEIQWINA